MKTTRDAIKPSLKAVETATYVAAVIIFIYALAVITNVFWGIL